MLYDTNSAKDLLIVNYDNQVTSTVQIAYWIYHKIIDELFLLYSYFLHNIK